MDAIFSTKQRIKILKHIIYRTDVVGVNSTAAELKLSKGLVSKYFELLAKKGILEKRNTKYMIIASSLTRGIKILLNVDAVDLRPFKMDFVKSVGLYGSCAKGDNDIDSDIDIWVRIDDEDQEKIAEFTSDILKKNTNCKLLLLTTDKIMKLRDDEVMFYHSLVFGSIILMGDQDGLQI